MKKYEIKQILKRCAKSIGIIPSNCIFCLKNLELERLRKDNRRKKCKTYIFRKI